MEVVSHPAFAELHPTFGHPESTERLDVLLRAFPDFREAGRAEVDDVQRCHSPRVLELLRSLDRPVYIEPNTVASETSYEAALLAAGCAIEAARSDAFALVRPPGHHATPVASFGFCLQAAGDAVRIAIVDFDVHHGNGTQDIFWEDETVFYASIHQERIFPGSGGPHEQAATTVNVPLRAGCGDVEWLAAFDGLIAPKIREFDPELVLVSAGFDAYEGEDLYLVDMHVTDDGFRELAKRCRALAPRVAAVLEGGYDVDALPRLVAAALEGFS